MAVSCTLCITLELVPCAPGWEAQLASTSHINSGSNDGILASEHSPSISANPTVAALSEEVDDEDDDDDHDDVFAGHSWDGLGATTA